MGFEVLFLEDDPIQTLIYKHLVSHHFPTLPVVFASEVSEAEDLLAKHPIKLAVLDLMIPTTNGADLIVKMKGEAAYQDIKIVVITSAEKGSLLHNVLDPKVNEYLTKPIFPKQFVDMLMRYLDIRRMTE